MAPDPPTRSSSPTPDDPDDPDLLIAVQALGNMRHRHRPPPSADPPPIPTPSPSPASSAVPSPNNIGSPRSHRPSLPFRVSDFPILSSAIRAYEHGKASSPVVKFGAEIVHSSVITVTRPVLSQIDLFASRNLGRLSARLASGSSHPSSAPPSHSIMSQEPSPTSSPTEAKDAPERRNGSATPNRWQSVVLEASSIGVAVSSESMRRLKYCLQWLQYATARIDDQIVALQEYLRNSSSSPYSSNSMSSRMSRINRIRADLVMTIRQVVEIISNYAGSALPEPARSRVREFILSLPQRWANAQAMTSSPDREDSARPTVETSPREELKGRVRARNSRNNSVSSPDKRIQSPPASEELEAEHANMNAAARRLLNLATESLDMLHNVTIIFNQSLERAEAWVERLRVVGIDPQSEPEEEPQEARPTRAGSSSTLSSSFPETPMTRRSEPSSQVTSDSEETNSEDAERRPRKTRKMDPKR